jgi:hypothetical protein
MAINKKDGFLWVRALIREKLRTAFDAKAKNQIILETARIEERNHLEKSKYDDEYSNPQTWANPQYHQERISKIEKLLKEDEIAIKNIEQIEEWFIEDFINKCN